MYHHQYKECLSYRIVTTGIAIFLIVILLQVQSASADQNATRIIVECNPGNGESGSWFWIYGTLSSSNDKPIAEKEIRLICSISDTMDPETSTQVSTNTDANGEFSFYTPFNQTEPYQMVTFDGDQYNQPCSALLSCEIPLIQKENIQNEKTEIANNTDFSFKTHTSPEQSATGSIIAASDPPGAEIFINNVLYGTTPKLLANIPCGAHEVCFYLPGYNNLTIGTYITPGKTSHIQSSLSRTGSPFGGERLLSSPQFSFPFSDNDSYIVIRQGDVSLYTLKNTTWVKNPTSRTGVPGSFVSSLITGSNATGFITTIVSSGDTLKKSTITFGKPHD